MNKIKKGDKVVVITGKDKGQVAEVLNVLENGNKLLLDGINQVKKHIKANPNTGERGGIVPKSMPIHRSNVMLLDPNTNKPSRIAINVLQDGKKVRVFKSSGQQIDVL